jgi:hypothetical protein
MRATSCSWHSAKEQKKNVGRRLFILRGYSLVFGSSSLRAIVRLMSIGDKAGTQLLCYGMVTPFLTLIQSANSLPSNTRKG